MFYEVKVIEKVEDDKGKVKKNTAILLVRAAGGHSEVQARIAELYDGSNFEWELDTVKLSKISEVVIDNKETVFGVN